VKKPEGIKAALAQIEKQFGAGSIGKLDDRAQDITAIRTGSIALDRALGVGGVPRGRIVEIYGPESSGKTTIALSVAAQAQAEGGIAAFVDAEHALDPSWAAKIGVDTSELLISQPDTGEQALEIVDLLVNSGETSVIIVDSVAALVPRAELEGDIGDHHVGLKARLMGQAIRKMAATARATDTTLIFINQLRFKVGVMMGSPETTPGGKALAFGASVRLDVRKVETLKHRDVPVGSRVKVKVAKNKVGPPLKIAHFDLLWDSGISRENELLDLGVDAGLITKSGAWLSFGEHRWQGREHARVGLVECPDIASELEACLMT